MSINTTPPWGLPRVTPVGQTLYGDGAISLNCVASYLDSATPKDAANLATPYEVTLPDGNYVLQKKEIYVPKTRELDSVPFLVRGHFVGGIGLLFSKIGTSAVLAWDGDGWHLEGGNAELVSTDTPVAAGAGGGTDTPVTPPGGDTGSDAAVLMVPEDV